MYIQFQLYIVVPLAYVNQEEAINGRYNFQTSKLHPAANKPQPRAILSIYTSRASTHAVNFQSFLYVWYADENITLAIVDHLYHVDKKVLHSLYSRGTDGCTACTACAT